MSISMVSAVLEIENEAQKILIDAEHEAEKIVADARTQRETASKASEEGVHRVISDMEARAAEERAQKVKELTALGEATLSTVRNISDAALEGGVHKIMEVMGSK